MRILVTNDDGIDSVGLHVLARALGPLGDVVVAAPDTEYSGASAALGALHIMRPEIHRTAVDGVAEAWAVTGPPALCVRLAKLGAFGAGFDLVVAGINPGANVGRAVYHSGTVGAAITGRNAGWNSVAVSQAVTFGSIEGQAWDEMILEQRWESAGEVAVTVCRALLDDPPSTPVALNVNVPNEPVEHMRGWRYTRLADLPIRAMTHIELEPKIGHDGTFRVNLGWGDAIALPEDTDAGAVEAGYVALTYLSAITPADPPREAATKAAALDALLGP
jgi:5'-nucleotidase